MVEIYSISGTNVFLGYQTEYLGAERALGVFF